MTKITTDDFLQNTDYFNVKKDEPHLPNDGDTPFTPYNDPTHPPVNPQDPHTDSEIDKTEAYNDGLADASGANDGHEDSEEQPKAHRLKSDFDD